MGLHSTHAEGPILYQMLPSVDQNWQDYMGDMRGMYLGIQEEQYLIKIIPETEDVKNELRKTLKDMEIIVTYESIYRKEFICSRKLDFFGRLLD